MTAHIMQHRRAAAAAMQRRDEAAPVAVKILDERQLVPIDGPQFTRLTSDTRFSIPTDFTFPLPRPPPVTTAGTPILVTTIVRNTVTLPTPIVISTPSSLITSPVIRPTPSTSATSVAVVTPPPSRTVPSPVSSSSSLRSSGSIVAASSTPSAVPPPSTSPGVSTGAVVGGIAGGILAVAALVFVVRYFLARKKKNEISPGAFDPNDFRRSAVLMNDAPTHEDTVSRGFNPPPPMVERRPAPPAAAYGSEWGAQPPFAAYGGRSAGQDFASQEYGGQGYAGQDSHAHSGQGYGAADNYGQYASFAPGQVMGNGTPQTSSTALFSPSAYGISPFSPLPSPGASVVPTYDGSHVSDLARQPFNGAMGMYPNAVRSVMPRRDSAGSGQTQYANYPTAQHNVAPQLQKAPNNTTEYVDLDRSSVTPYQAAQYAEISRKLKTEVPKGLDTPAVQQFIHTGPMSSVKEDDGPPPVPQKPSVSPFADPSTPKATNLHLQSESIDQEIEVHAPHSLAHSRVDSTPPMLPEIFVQSRDSVNSYDFPSSVRGSGTPGQTPTGSTFAHAGNGPSLLGKSVYPESPLVSRFPATPSPMASSFAIPSPPVGRSFHTAMTPPAPAPVAAPAQSKTQQRPETVYDPEDAYGGI